MPISLEFFQQKLMARIRTLDAAFERHYLMPVALRRIDRFALQEGLISGLWQSWCNFCRDVVIASAQGATTQGGRVTSSPYTANSNMEIAYIAKRLSRRETITSVRPLAGNHQEPTWGDVSKLNLIITGIGCSNNTEMLTAFGACQRIPDLQICRNASAHINAGTVQDVNSTAVRYNNTKFHHPSDLMFWIDPATNEFVWKSWIDEIELTSFFAVQ